MHVTVLCFFLLQCVLLFTSSYLFAWGERGHTVVTRVASELLKTCFSKDSTLAEVFSKKQLMLAYLSNVPDNVWKSNLVSSEIKNINAPTHWTDLEYLCQKPSLTCVSSDINVAKKIAKEQGKDLIKEVGTVIWRIPDLSQYLVEAFKTVLVGENKKFWFVSKKQHKEQTQKLLQVLIYAGVLSHFVGDAAQPLHLTIDYDGKLKGQEGLHSYFEEDIVDVYGLDLELLVLNYSLANKPFENLIISKLKEYNLDVNFSNIAVALAVNSYEQLDELFSIDKKYAMVSSTNESVVLRKNPKEVYKFFEPLVIKQLALAADVLANIWILSWKIANEPVLNTNELHFAYPILPNFVYPRYLE